MQAADALHALHPELEWSYLALIGKTSTPQWQSDLIGSHLPATQPPNTFEPGSAPSSPGSAHVRPPHSTAAVAQAAAALHGLPSTWQPASADAFSCVRSIGSMLELVSALLAVPPVMLHVGSDSTGTLVTALYKLMPWAVKAGSYRAETLLGAIREHGEALVQRIEQEGYQRQHACLLGLLHTWKVRCIVCA